MPKMLTGLPDLDRTIINHKLLTAEEEIDLIKRAQKGDVLSRHKLITHNLRFVISERNKMIDIKSSNQTTLDECFSLGIIALHKSIDGFKVTKKIDKKARFATYAKWHIKAEIIKYFAEGGIIKVPQSSASKIRKAQLESEKNDVPFNIKNITIGKCDKVLKKHGANKKCAIAVLTAKNANSTSMQQNIFGDSTERCEFALVETEKVEPPDCGDIEIIRDHINEALNKLTDREAIILILRFGLDGGKGLTLDHISKIFGLTRERIRQIQKDSLQKLKRTHISNLLH